MSTPSPSLRPLEEKFADLVDTAIDAGEIYDASIYVRILENGSWTGMNVDTTYTPASLMKVPILIAYLRQADYNPDFLSYTVIITEDPAEGMEQDIPPEESVQVGETYTLEELLRLMIVHSDNRALNVLSEYLDVTVLENTFTDLGIAVPSTEEAYEISPKLYSRFLRILYNATYLSEERSEQALRLLGESVFHEGIRAGIPDDVRVAHKFGEAAAVFAYGTRGHELHDCGIVYAEIPYALCVMTKGENVENLSAFLAHVSEETYRYITSLE